MASSAASATCKLRHCRVRVDSLTNYEIVGLELTIVQINSGSSDCSRLLINHSLLPLSCLPRETSGGEDKERGHLFRRALSPIESPYIRSRGFINALLVS